MGGSFADDRQRSDAVSADSVLLSKFGGKLDKLATNEVIESLSRTTEVGLKGVGTSFQVGIKTGMDPLGDTATRILARAEDPKAPPVMAEIKGHLLGLEEIQQTYLNNGDVKLAQKVQTNIDTLHALIGSVDTNRAVTERLASDARSSDAAMLQTAATAVARQGETKDAVHTLNANEGTRAANIIAVQNAAKDAVHNFNASEGRRWGSSLAKQDAVIGEARVQKTHLATIAAKDFSPRVNVNVSNFVSVHQFQRVAQSANRAYSDLSGGT